MYTKYEIVLKFLLDTDSTSVRQKLKTYVIQRVCFRLEFPKLYPALKKVPTPERREANDWVILEK